MRPDFRTLDEITRKLAAALPPELAGARDELRNPFRGVLEGLFNRMDLVTREEFEIQRQLLMRTREKLDALEKRLAGKGEDAGISGA